MISKLFENGICTGFDMKCINNGDCNSCKTLIEYANQEPQLDSDIEKAINYFKAEILNFNKFVSETVESNAHYDKELLKHINTIKQALVDKDKLIYESQKSQMNMKSKLDKIEEIANRKFSISRRLEDIQRELDDSIK